MERLALGRLQAVTAALPGVAAAEDPAAVVAGCGDEDEGSGEAMGSGGALPDQCHQLSRLQFWQGVVACSCGQAGAGWPPWRWRLLPRPSRTASLGPTSRVRGLG
jgi:hypothetical protein